MNNKHVDEVHHVIMNATESLSEGKEWGHYERGVSEGVTEKGTVEQTLEESGKVEHSRWRKWHEQRS